MGSPLVVALAVAAGFILGVRVGIALARRGLAGPPKRRKRADGAAP
ncbi:MAG: hypothetical protein KC657_02835 [Myxococcales bacterium]|nr:hypothetical protein [Myxococcales bacterium]